MGASQVAGAGQGDACRRLEDGLAGIGVGMVEVYASADFDKAAAAAKKAAATLKELDPVNAACKCPSVVEPLAEIRVLLRTVPEQTGFDQVQDIINDVMVKSESARQSADQCWRESAKPKV